MATLNGKDSDRVPCVNTVSVATIEFMKASDAYWPAAHKDPIKMASLGSAAHRICGLDNVTVPFCMTVEAECLGGSINIPCDTITWPSASIFQVREVSDLKFPRDISKAGRVPTILNAIRILKKEFDGIVPVNVYLTPPFTSISNYLVGNLTFLKWLRTEPKKVHEFMDAAVDFYVELAELYQEAGADVITLHEMGASSDIISPRAFNEFVKPYLGRIIKQIRTPTVLNVCGSAFPILDMMIECGASAIALDEKTPIPQARLAIDRIKPGYPIIGNISPLEVIHKGPIPTIKESVKKSIEDGVDMIAPGCDFWLETPTLHIKVFVQACIELGREK